MRLKKIFTLFTAMAILTTFILYEKNVEVCAKSASKNVIKQICFDSSSGILCENGDLYCFGYQQGTDESGWECDQYKPIKVMEDVEKFDACGMNAFAAIKTNGDLYCWGSTAPNVGIYSNKKEFVMSNVKDVRTSGGNTLALTIEGDVYAWGYNSHGNVGNGSTEEVIQPVKVLSDVVKIYCEGSISAAIKSNGDLYCWGGNGFDSLVTGDDSAKDQLVPRKILENVKDVAAGQYNVAAINGDGMLYCWGENWNGNVGDGTSETRVNPVRIMSNIVKVGYGYNVGVALSTNGDLYTWGYNYYGQCGDGTTEKKTSPQKIIENIKDFSVEWDHVAALTNENDLYCWGRNGDGQIGVPNVNEYEVHKIPNELRPVKILQNVKLFDTGTAETAAVLTSGEIYSWGSNISGSIGLEKGIFFAFTPQLLDYDGSFSSNGENDSQTSSSSNSNTNNNSASDSNNESLDEKTVTGKYKDGAFDKNFTFKTEYSNSYFSEDATKTKKDIQGKIAKLSMLAAATAYHENHAKSFMSKQLGFSCVEYNSYEYTLTDNNHVNYVIGFKNTEKYTIVGIWIKGTGSKTGEWISNFNVGFGNEHKGFKKSEKELYKNVSIYMDKFKSRFRSDVKFWITGHSRGAAVANLLGTRLSKGGKYSKKNIFTYTFASPYVSKK